MFTSVTRRGFITSGSSKRLIRFQSTGGSGNNNNNNGNSGNNGNNLKNSPLDFNFNDLFKRIDKASIKAAEIKAEAQAKRQKSRAEQQQQRKKNEGVNAAGERQTTNYNFKNKSGNNNNIDNNGSFQSNRRRRTVQPQNQGPRGLSRNGEGMATAGETTQYKNQPRQRPYRSEQNPDKSKSFEEGNQAQEKGQSRYSVEGSYQQQQQQQQHSFREKAPRAGSDSFSSASQVYGERANYNTSPRTYGDADRERGFSTHRRSPRRLSATNASFGRSRRDAGGERQTTVRPLANRIPKAKRVERTPTGFRVTYGPGITRENYGQPPAQEIVSKDLDSKYLKPEIKPEHFFYGKSPSIITSSVKTRLASIAKMTLIDSKYPYMLPKEIIAKAPTHSTNKFILRKNWNVEPAVDVLSRRVNTIGLGKAESVKIESDKKNSSVLLKAAHDININGSYTLEQKQSLINTVAALDKIKNVFDGAHWKKLGAAATINQ
ncbi:hypothetical protein PP707_04520 [Acetobacter pasteurianus]|nr:hypothetical protein [Acetobacter pasteurianus]